MFLRSFKTQVVLFAVLTVLCLRPEKAEAKIPFLISYGDTISQLAPLPADKKEILEKATKPGSEVGYKYSYFGLFFLDLWTWGGEYCLFHDKSFWSLKPEQAAELLGVPVEKLPKPFFYRFPSLLSLLVLGLLGFIILSRFIKTDEEEAAELLKDEKYREALDLFRKKYEELQAAAAPAPASAEQPVAATDAAPAEAPAKASTEAEGEEKSETDAAPSPAVVAALAVGIAHLTQKGVAADVAATKLALLSRVEILSKKPESVAAAAT